MTRPDCTPSEAEQQRAHAAPRRAWTLPRTLVAAVIRRFPLLLLVWLLDGAVARAAPDLCQRAAACRQLSEQAATAYREQRYYDAFRLLKQAYASSHEPRLLVNLGRCMERLGLRDDAVAAYERFLAEDTVFDPAERARVQRFVDEARAAPRLQWEGTGAATSPPAVRTDSPVADAGGAPPAVAPRMQPGADRPSVLPEQSSAPASIAALPTGAAATQAPAVVVVSEDRARARPVYKSPWLWVGIGGGVAAIAVAVGIAAGMQRTASYHVVEWP